MAPDPRAVLLGVALGAAACHGSSDPVAAPAAVTDGERHAAARLEAVRHDPAALTRLLQRFPPGGDLHNHMTGAVYAESYLAWAREDGFVVNEANQLVLPERCRGRACTPVPASPADPAFELLVRAWSMKDFSPGAETGHDHFFSAFGRFSAVAHEDKRQGFVLAEAIRRAADSNAIYLELLVSAAAPIFKAIAHDAGALDPQDLPGFERKLHADPRWSTMLATSRQRLVERDAQARALLHCDAPDAEPGCRVTVRYLDQIGRAAQPGLVFAELVAGFELAADEPRIVGVNLVAPEDDPTARYDYDLHMAMFAALEEQYRGVTRLRIALHAGELTAALVPTGDLQSHIRAAVEHGHAERIGHGVDALQERDSPGLLTELRDRGVTVEICLSSNALILGVSGAAHPLRAYLAAGVPVVLATDDPGVSRSSLTGELVRAVTDQAVTYAQLKAMARQSLTAAFVPGASLWAADGAPHRVDACAAPQPSPSCTAFLASSERARLQWQLELQLAAFEAE